MPSYQCSWHGELLMPIEKWPHRSCQDLVGLSLRSSRQHTIMVTVCSRSSMHLFDVPSRHSWLTSRQRWRAMSAGWKVLTAIFAPPARAVPWALCRAASPSWACPASRVVPSPSSACCQPLPLGLRLLHASLLRRSRLLLLALHVLLARLGLQAILLCGILLSRRGNSGCSRPTALKAAAT